MILESLNLNFSCQKNVLKTQFNCSWFCLLSFLGGWVTLQFPQVPERYFGHLACQMGCRVHSMRQVPYRKPPFYCPSTRQVSYKMHSLTSFTDAYLHEQILLKLNDTAWYSDLQEVEKRSDLSPQKELQAAKNRSFWSTIRTEESSGDLLTKRLTAKASSDHIGR